MEEQTSLSNQRERRMCRVWMETRQEEGQRCGKEGEKCGKEELKCHGEGEKCHKEEVRCLEEAEMYHMVGE